MVGASFTIIPRPLRRHNLLSVAAVYARRTLSVWVISRIKNFTPEWPILPIVHQTCAHRIFTHILPFLLVLFLASQDMSEETLLPMRADNSVEAQRLRERILNDSIHTANPTL
jgi:hypothetical protein